MTNNEQLFTDMLPSEEANLSGGMGINITSAGAKAVASATGNKFTQAITSTDARSINNDFAQVNTALAVSFGAGLSVNI